MTRRIAIDTYSETFIVRQLNAGWDWRDFLVGGCEYDYCVNELDIPEEFLLQAIADFRREEMEITLYGLPANTAEDWLVNLNRLQNFDSE